ncbi:centrosomal protein, putative (macronuclear) [Tetrahymena thermophila SB210]|uniref:Centrosomal protein, putative n=1 Tax=Tetrahymena thermophila (strain SB210) TaxID=312017 RepID=Q248C4_TETTS|nr:centrosomal protein, putative [Tetrahymena thermophila SB210]EAS04121.2 centrosomal protein, putative [Tetrahymena thermophila SB210]|eukprot:XP_001024366.2 centrosomal protein, putative [Tetrahymena thermophila SB210]
MSNYSQDFELDEEENKEIKDFNKQSEANQNPQNPEHRLRLSIDVHSLKEHDFRGNIYARYQSLINLNIKQFKSAPPISITKPRVEEKFPNSFRSYTFDCTQANLNDRLQGEFEIELWHQDRLKKDILIGICKYNFSNIMKGQVRKTSQSYAKVSDAYLPVDEVDDNRNPIKKVAELRVIFYLEDLGPKEQIIRKEKQLGIKSNDEIQDLLEGNNNINQQGDQDVDYPAVVLPEKNDLFGDLEYKIIWELETWKKAEEAKFKITLKQKEMEFLQKLSEEWRTKEIEKERVFKKIEASMNLLNKKSKEKAMELQKREQKIVLLEEELKTRITETSRQISLKDEEIAVLKRKIKDQQGNSEKDKTALKLEFEQLKEEYANMKKEYEKYKKEQENSPISLVKNELKDKMLEIKELKKELQKANEIKEQHKVYYEKLRAELLKQKKQYEMLKEENNFKNNGEIEQLRNEIQLLKQQKENVEPNMNINATAYRRNQQEIPKALVVDPTYSNVIDQNANYEEYDWNQDNMGELERLIYERDYYLRTAGYQENDPLIIQLNNQIRAKQV